MGAAGSLSPYLSLYYENERGDYRKCLAETERNGGPRTFLLGEAASSCAKITETARCAKNN
jgi:hypothetical protein